MKLLKSPKLGGPGALRLLLDDIPAARSREILGISARTLRRWLAPGGNPPRAALQALFWHTRWGDSQIRSEYGFELQLLAGLARTRSAETVAQVRHHVARPAANDGAAPGLRLVRGPV